MVNTLSLTQALSEGSISFHDLPEEVQLNSTYSNSDESLEDLLKGMNWNITAVANYLGCERSTIYRRMKRAGIVIDRHDKGLEWFRSAFFHPINFLRVHTTKVYIHLRNPVPLLFQAWSTRSVLLYQPTNSWLAFRPSSVLRATLCNVSCNTYLYSCWIKLSIKKLILLTKYN